METNKSKIFSQIVASSSVIVSILAIITLYFTFNLKENIKLSETFIALALGGIASFLAAYVAKFFIKKKNEKVFILYSHDDKEFVGKLRQDLEKLSYNTFTDADVLKVGDRISDVIDNTIDKSDLIIYVISSNTQKSSFVKRELEKAIKLKKKILPLIISKESEIPRELTGILYADFTEDYSKSLTKLIIGIENSSKLTSVTKNTL